MNEWRDPKEAPHWKVLMAIDSDGKVEVAYRGNDDEMWYTYTRGMIKVVGWMYAEEFFSGEKR